MTKKRIPSDDEIEVMAKEILPHLRRGETIRPFIRRNQDQLRSIVQDESWATLALVLTKVGVTYGTGTPWTGRSLHHEFIHATAASKRRENRAPESPQKPPLKDDQPVQNGLNVTPPVECTQTAPKLRFAPATIRRPAPPKILTDEETARRDALDERVFGKIVRR
jgi:hypothetical protein